MELHKKYEWLSLNLVRKISSNWIKPVALRYFNILAIFVIYALLISPYCFDSILSTYLYGGLDMGQIS